MFRRLFIFAGCCVTFLGLPAYGQAPYFFDPAYLFTETDTVKVNMYSIPHVCDWDSDGDKDLLVGQFINGHILFFENIQTHTDPFFADPVFLYADGSIISLPYS